ncbi:vitamin K epoxide reductase family protein [Acidobacteriia bacterium AH_259_A11_L15]|nr:vitamin K epoxide reductase family protein [Acidobacteriia bacterium AH_259_A11_L15]
MASWWLLGLSLLGLAVSLYFTLVYYGRIESRELPTAFCRRNEQTCVTILQTPYARVLGPPNSVLGIGLYVLTALVAALALAGALPPWLWGTAVVAVAVAVLLAPYLVWALVARLKTWCRL